MKGSWKTTVGGVLMAVGQMAQASSDKLASPEAQSWAHFAGLILTAAGAFFLGVSARDNNKSSEDVGAK